MARRRAVRARVVAGKAGSIFARDAAQEVAGPGTCALDGADFPSRVLRVNAPRVQDVVPATARIGQDHQCRKLSAHCHRRRPTFRQVVHVQMQAIRRGTRLGTHNVAGIQVQQQPGPLWWSRQMSEQHPLQVLSLDASIFKGFIQADPLPLKERRERQVNKMVCRRFRKPRIDRVEQRIGGTRETAVDFVTKLIQCVW